MENKRNGFFDDNEEDLTGKADVTTAQKYEKEEQRNNFEQSVSADSYHKRGFIKDGELIAEPEVLFIHPTLSDVDQVETEIGDITLYNDPKARFLGSDQGIYKITAELTPTVEEMEQYLLKALSDNAKKFSTTEVTIYAFAPFNNAAVKDVVAGDYYEFIGRFEFIKAMRGWVLLSFNKAVRLPE